jgi:hypothetical protein
MLLEGGRCFICGYDWSANGNRLGLHGQDRFYYGNTNEAMSHITKSWKWREIDTSAMDGTVIKIGATSRPYNCGFAFLTDNGAMYGVGYGQEGLFGIGYDADMGDWFESPQRIMRL